MQEELLGLLAARKGHFRLESGYHGDLWLDLELLCLRPQHIRPFALELAKRLPPVDAVCGPLVEGAFVALMVACELDVEFFYAERFAHPERTQLYPVEYRLPKVQRGRVRGKRVAIINDVINAGSAVRGTYEDLKACGAEPVVIGSLVVLGTSATSYATEKKIQMKSVASLPNQLWTPSECPLCAAGVALTA